MSFTTKASSNDELYVDFEKVHWNVPQILEVFVQI